MDISDLIAKFKDSHWDSIEYGCIRDNCGIPAADFELYAKEHGIHAPRVYGYFKVDKPQCGINDFYKHELKHMSELGYDPSDENDRLQYVIQQNKTDEQCKIPHYWNEYNGRIIDFTGHSQFVKTGMAADTNTERYIKDEQMNEGTNRPTTRIPGLDYQEKTKTKSSDVVDQVIVTLEGSKSGTYTKLAKRYKKMKELEAQVKKEKDELNKLLKERVDELFPEDDDVYTRVVDTASIVIKVAKAEKEKTIDTFDAEGYIKEIEEMFPELEEAFKTVREKYTGIKKVAAKSPKLLTPKLKESKETKSFFDMFKRFLKMVSAKIKLLLSDVDYKIAQLELKVERDAAK